jgi:pSer/pThr/pTyr-binding forkhead associated (FHA) protein
MGAMVTLTVIDEAGNRQIPLKQGAVFIGRAKDNDVNLADKALSAHHAKIVTYFDASYIEDLASTNGTFINGKRVKMHTLHPGDEIKLGLHRFIVNS